jgi:hypothetical protein
VTQEEDTTGNGISTIRFTQTSSNKSAIVIADGHYRSVTATNVHAAKSNQVACISPG